jgi:hypothetical protein
MPTHEKEFMDKDMYFDIDVDAYCKQNILQTRSQTIKFKPKNLVSSQLVKSKGALIDLDSLIPFPIISSFPVSIKFLTSMILKEAISFDIFPSEPKYFLNFPLH